jgi:carboxyl-terminal processing protease
MQRSYIVLAKILLISLLTVLISSKTIQATANQVQLPFTEVQKLTKTINIIRKFYVEKKTDKEILDDAIQGMLENLDPHSTYLDKDEYKSLNQSTSGEFGGLGIEVTMKYGVVKVISPIDDTPAKKAGIQAGDLIVKLNDKSVKGMSLSEAVDIMRGKPGSKIDLVVVRKNKSKPINLTITRDTIEVDSVKSKIINQNYGYIRISMFQTDTNQDLEKAIKKLENKSDNQLKGIILDLRNNPGGVLQSAVEVADTFLNADELKSPKRIVYTKGRVERSEFIGKAESPDRIDGLPMVTLVNSGSASASEIVAGALKDYNRSIIAGIKTFGKGSVQTVIPLDNETAIKLTTARYYTPDGHEIQGNGIKPDVHIGNIEVPYKDTQQKSKRWRVREQNLSHSLKNEKAESQKDQNENSADQSSKKTNQTPADYEKIIHKSDQKGETKSVLYKDFQLYEALTILKAMASVHAQQSADKAK